MNKHVRKKYQKCLGAVLALLVIGMALAILAWNWDSLWPGSRQKASLSDPITSERHRQVGPDIRKVLEQLELANQLQSIAESKADRCSKVAQGKYESDTLQCYVRITHFYGFNDLVEQRLVSLETNLLQDNWHDSVPSNATPPIRRQLADYSSRGTILKQLTAHYDLYDTSKSASNSSFYMQIGYVAKDQTDPDLMSSIQVSQGSQPIHDASQLLDGPAVYKNITAQYQHVLAVAVEQIYFSD